MSNGDYINYVPIIRRWGVICGKLARPFLVIAAGICAFTLLKSFFQEPEYTATARMLPPFGEQDSLAVMQGAMGGYPTPSWWEPEDTNEANFIIIGMLKSDLVVDHVTASTKLVKRLELESVAEARTWLRSHSEITQDKHKLLVINVTTHEPELSQEIANAFLAGLKDAQRTLRKSQRSYQQAQVEARVSANRESLAKVEMSFERFKSEHNIVDVDTQTKSTVELLAHIQQLDASLRVEMSGYSPFLSEKTSTVGKLKSRLAKIEELEGSLLGEESSSESLALPDLKVLPSLQREFAAFTHQIELLRETSHLLNKQLEVIRVYEAGMLPETTVLDYAPLPYSNVAPSKPKLLLIAIVITFFLYLIGVALTDLALHFLPSYIRELRPLRFAYRILEKRLGLVPMIADPVPVAS
ncbi:MAG: hypothetical protein AAGA58_08465 [Verrucomicrobiota bacterium]